jgi:hypothetical protein
MTRIFLESPIQRSLFPRFELRRRIARRSIPLRFKMRSRSSPQAGVEGLFGPKTGRTPSGSPLRGLNQQTSQREQPRKAVAASGHN